MWALLCLGFYDADPALDTRGIQSALKLSSTCGFYNPHQRRFSCDSTTRTKLGFLSTPRKDKAVKANNTTKQHVLHPSVNANKRGTHLLKHDMCTIAKSCQQHNVLGRLKTKLVVSSPTSHLRPWISWAVCGIVHVIPPPVKKVCY